MRSPIRARTTQHGGMSVEFALVFSVFSIMLIGIMEMGRLLWSWNAAVEATRRGARMAVVCDLNDSDIKIRMREMFPALSNSNITITYLDPPNADNTCTTATCKAVKVSLSGFSHTTNIPFVSMTANLPAFTTTLRREYMESTGNPMCS
jgi:Flp pilus assembly protein TadG